MYLHCSSPPNQLTAISNALFCIYLKFVCVHLNFFANCFITITETPIIFEFTWVSFKSYFKMQFQMQFQNEVSNFTERTKLSVFVESIEYTQSSSHEWLSTNNNMKVDAEAKKGKISVTSSRHWTGERRIRSSQTLTKMLGGISTGLWFKSNVSRKIANDE